MLRKLPLDLFSLLALTAADGGGGGTGAPANQPPKGDPPAPQPDGGEDWKKMTTEQFKERLGAERGAGVKALLAELGFKSNDEAKKFLDEAKKRLDADKTELQRAQEAAATLKGADEKAKGLEASLKEYLAAEEAAIPEAKRGLLDLAPPAEDLAGRLKWISSAKTKGLFADAAAPAGEKKPATSQGGGKPPPTPTPANHQKHPRDMTPEERKKFERETLGKLPK